jgi:hypothetical protein
VEVFAIGISKPSPKPTRNLPSLAYCATTCELQSTGDWSPIFASSSNSLRQPLAPMMRESADVPRRSLMHGMVEWDSFPAGAHGYLS